MGGLLVGILYTLTNQCFSCTLPTNNSTGVSSYYNFTIHQIYAGLTSGSTYCICVSPWQTVRGRNFQELNLLLWELSWVRVASFFIKLLTFQSEVFMWHSAGKYKLHKEDWFYTSLIQYLHPRGRTAARKEFECAY